MYDITEYTRNRLKQLNKKLNTDKITIEQSKNKDKKIDVFINNKKVADIGAIDYKDYPTYTKEKGKDYADGRRKLYYRRHSKEDDIKEGKITPSWWARWLLW
jgi:hypothetical protein